MFVLGVCGILFNHRDILIVLVCVELMLLATGLLGIIGSIYHDDFVGQVFALFILTVAAGESAVGLGIFIQYYRIKGNILLWANGFLRG